MKLYLAQHGQAVTRDEDPARPLSEQGVHEVTAIADLLGGAGIRVARVWHSGKCRAEQTAGILAHAVLAGGDIETIKGVNPNDPVDEFASDADVWEEDTLVVGHLPFMSRLVSQLVMANAEHSLVQYVPGSLVCLERVEAERWEIAWMVRPDAIQKTVQG